MASDSESTSLSVRDSDEYSKQSGDESDSPSDPGFELPTTYTSYIEDEECLMDSLITLRYQDLGQQLYNAYEVQKGPCGAKNVEEVGGWDGNEEVEDMAFDEEENWTAWPLLAEDVPRLDDAEQGVSDDGWDHLTTRRRDDLPSIAALDDILNGLILKAARQRYEARAWKSPEREASYSETTPAMEDPLDSHGQSKEKCDVHRAQSSHVESSRKQKLERSDAFDALGRYIGDDDDFLNSDVDVDDDRSFQEDDEDDKCSDEDAIQLQPATSLDDDNYAHILQPSTRHVLSQLDSVLKELNRARATFSEADSSSSATSGFAVASSESELNSSDIDANAPRSESFVPRVNERGRPRKLFAILGKLPSESCTTGAAASDSNATATRSGKTGRPRGQDFQAMEGESQHDMLKRIANRQKRSTAVIARMLGLILADGELAPKSTLRSQRSSSDEIKSPVLNSSSGSSSSDETEPPGLRDWSDIMDVAALAGLPHNVIERARKRCANLFEESIDEHLLGEELYEAVPVEDGETPVFIPQTIREHPLSDHSDEVDESSRILSQQSVLHHQSQSRNPARRKSKTSPSSNESQTSSTMESDTGSDEDVAQSTTCPMDDCPRYGKAFAERESLRAHILRVHQMTEESARDIMALKSSQEMFGGVHVDGYLQAIDIQDWEYEAKGKLSGNGRGEGFSYESRDVSAEDSTSDSHDSDSSMS